MRTVTKLAALRALWEAITRQRRPGSPSLGTRVRALPRLVRDTLSGRYPGLDRSRLGLMAVAVAYIVSPIDLLPEAFLLLGGLVDDALVLAWLAGTVLSETEAYLDWQDQQVHAPRESRTVPGSVL